MKVLMYIIFLLTCNHSFAKTKYNYPKDKFGILENTIISQSISEQKQIAHLQKIKYLIINGNLNSAKILLKEANLNENFSKSTQYRYLAIINFIQKNYSEVIKILSDSTMNDFTAIQNTCMMKILSLLILNKIERAKLDWKVCRDSLINKSPTNLAWMDTIFLLKTSNDPKKIDKIFQGISVDNLENDQLRLYLKLAFYLNKQDKILDRFQYFGENVLSDPIYRELIGLNYFRAGKLEKAYSILENLETTNAEVFKGNLYLFQKKYELAYAQYKLALQKKNNSLNAIERLLPLSWQLEQWTEGLDYAQRLNATKNQKIEHLTLISAFLTMMDKHKTAKKKLQEILQMTNQGQAHEVSQILVYNGLSLNNYDDVQNFSYQSCKSLDGLNY